MQFIINYYLIYNLIYNATVKANTSRPSLWFTERSRGPGQLDGLQRVAVAPMTEAGPAEWQTKDHI
jgi:hypothetical protein